MAEIHVSFDHYATIEVERYKTSAGVTGFRARVAESVEVEHAVQEVAPTAPDALRAVADKLVATTAVVNPGGEANA